MLITIQWQSLMLMELILDFIASLIYQMGQVLGCAYFLLFRCFFIPTSLNAFSSTSTLRTLDGFHGMVLSLCGLIPPLFSGYEEKFYFNPGDTGFKVGTFFHENFETTPGFF